MRLDGIVIERALQPTGDVRMLIGGLEAELARDYAPEQRHGLPLDALFQPHIRLFVARLNDVPAGCAGIALLEGFAEIKRMFVPAALRGRGVAPALLSRLEDEARAEGYGLLRLETGIHQPAAVKLYQRHGFMPRGAFGDYLAMPAAAIVTSRFFEKPLPAGSGR